MKRAIALILVATLGAACGQTAVTDAPTPKPSGLPTQPAPSPSPTPGASAGADTLPFVRVANVHGIAELYAITAFDAGFVAGGCRLRPPAGGSEGGCASAVVLHSRDGSAWSEVALPDSSGVRIVGLSDTPLGVLAFGTTQRSEPPQARIIWRLAADDRWEPFSMPAPASIVFRTAAVVGGRTVFLGADTAFDLSVETELWSTVDGASWSNGSSPLSPKVAAAPGLIAVGDECVDVCEPGSSTHVYRSADGITWTEDEVPPALASTTVESLTAWNGRGVLGGGRDGRATVWLADPAGWRQVILPGAAGMSVSGLLVSTEGIIAVGRSIADDPPAAWWSPDGIAWSPARLDPIALGYVVASAPGNPLVVILDYDSIWVAAF